MLPSVVALVVLTFGALGFGGTLDFESLADFEPVTTQFPSLTFTNATVLTAGISLNEFEFPPHSGAKVVFDDSGAIEIVFASPVTRVGGFFTYSVPLTLTAFNASGEVIGTARSAFTSNLALSGAAGSRPNEFIEVVVAEGTISHVEIEGDPFGASFTLDDLTFIDTTPPDCKLTRVIAGPPTQIQITTQDTGSGLAEINLLEQTNATVAFTPPLTPGTMDPVVVTATKIIQSQGSRVALEVIDGSGNLTTCDPILTQAIRANGQPVSDTLSGIPQEESQVTVRNGNPGVAQLEIDVNGTTFRVSGLAANQEKTIDVSPAMVAGDINTIILTAYGKPGASATILIHD